MMISSPTGPLFLLPFSTYHILWLTTTTPFCQMLFNLLCSWPDKRRCPIEVFFFFFFGSGLKNLVQVGCIVVVFKPLFSVLKKALYNPPLKKKEFSLGWNHFRPSLVFPFDYISKFTHPLVGDTEEDRVARAFNKATSSIQRHALLSFKTCTPLLCLAEREMSLRLFSFLCVCVCVVKGGLASIQF